MDWGLIQWVLQFLIGGIVGIVSTVVMRVLDRVTERLDQIDEDLKSYPNIYARRDDVTQGFDRIYKTLERIESKVDKVHNA